MSTPLLKNVKNTKSTTPLHLLLRSCTLPVIVYVRHKYTQLLIISYILFILNVFWIPKFKTKMTYKYKSIIKSTRLILILFILIYILMIPYTLINSYREISCKWIYLYHLWQTQQSYFKIITQLATQTTFFYYKRPTLFPNKNNTNNKIIIMIII